MHLHLAVLCNMWRYLIGRYVVSEGKAKALTAHLDTLGVGTKKIRKTFERQIKEGSGQASEQAPEWPTFNGAACWIVLKNFGDFLAFVHAEGSSEKRRIEAAVSAYIDFLRAVSPAPDVAAEGEGGDEGERARRARDAAWEQYWSTQAKRDAQAAIVKAKARTFVAALANSPMPAEGLESVYVHVLTCHIEAHVKAYGPLWFWSGEGLEHKNYIWKQTGRATAQRGKAGHQNGGQKPRDGSAQKRTAPGREGQTFMNVLDGENRGGTTQREGRNVRPRHSMTALLGGS